MPKEQTHIPVPWRVASSMGKNIWICGGKIYREAPLSEELHLTQIDASFEGDAFFQVGKNTFPMVAGRR